ncbi:phosphoribosylglycinamide synthetase C domain-containing protein, partial [Robiginitalea sp.]|uniref:phosphoribosylglycinamide synthetase C domain-containing protein n=1 Tax=Robiginitalea sp. TaxID=1902411 RepID=UPI003C727CE7
IKVGDDPFVIEYNVRMGDPETEVVIPRIQTDLVELLRATAGGTLKETDLVIRKEAAATVMMVSGGYPEAYQKGHAIHGLESVKEAMVFHAGTQKDSNGDVVTSGGRVLAVTALGADFKDSLRKAYAGVSEIEFEDAYYRTDIGFDL